MLETHEILMTNSYLYIYTYFNTCEKGKQFTNYFKNYKKWYSDRRKICWVFLSNIKWLHLFIAFLHWDIFLFQAVVNIVRYLRIDLFAVKRSYLLNLYKCACSIKMHAITHSTVIVSQLVVQAAEYSYLSTNIQENHMMSPKDISLMINYKREMLSTANCCVDNYNSIIKCHNLGVYLHHPVC